MQDMMFQGLLAPRCSPCQHGHGAWRLALPIRQQQTWGRRS